MAYRQNNNEKRDEKERQRNAAGLVSERYPEVANIVVHMTYNHKAVNPVLMERTLYFSPDNYAVFFMGCMTRSCENGGYNLAPVIANMVREHNESGKGMMICRGENTILSPDHASISYKIKVEYKSRQ